MFTGATAFNANTSWNSATGFDDGNSNGTPQLTFWTSWVDPNASTAFTSRVALKTAVDAWIADSAAAAQTYGNINNWDVSGVTDMLRCSKALTLIAILVIGMCPMSQICLRCSVVPLVSIKISVIGMWVRSQL